MTYGLGNWTDIAENQVKSKDAKQCENHYFGVIYPLENNPKSINKDSALEKQYKHKVEQYILG
jgi:hypothetical protein